MKVKQARLAQPIRGEISNIIDEAKYGLVFDKGMLHVSPKANPRKTGDFVVFPANIAWLETEPEIKSEEEALREITELNAKIKAAEETFTEKKAVVATKRGRPAANG